MKDQRHAQVYVVGEVGIQEELDLKGIAHIGGPADAEKKIELKPGFALPHDHDVLPALLFQCLTPAACAAFPCIAWGGSADELSSLRA